MEHMGHDLKCTLTNALLCKRVICVQTELLFVVLSLSENEPGVYLLNGDAHSLASAWYASGAKSKYGHYKIYKPGVSI